MWLLILSVVGALLISGLCSLMESVLLSLRGGQIADMAQRRPKIAAIWQQFKADIERPIAAILILNTAAHTIGAAVAGAQFGRIYGEGWLWAFSLVFTFLMLQFTEILPKSLGVRYNGPTAVWIARPLDGLIRLTRPVQALVHLINRPFGGAPARAQLLSATEEITALTGFARLSGEISGEHASIIERGTLLARSRVRDVMRPRVDIDALDVDTPPEQVVGAVTMSGFSRVPVYEKDLDHIFGFVYIKDLLLELYMGRPIELRRLIRPALLVPETLRLDKLVEMFREKRTQIAVVLDEHGGTEGLVTMEDVLEELVGTIHDEHRREDAELLRQDETHWLANGTAGLHRLFEAVGRPELREATSTDISTVGGLVQAELGRIAAPGDRVAFRDLLLEVLDVEGLRIAHVRVTVLQQADG